MKTQVLIICTSQGSNEYSDYWKKNNTEYAFKNQLIIIQGYEKSDTFLTQEITKKIDSFKNQGFDIYILWHRGSTPRSEQGTTQNGTKYTCFYYSTTDQSLNDFWSYKSGEEWKIPYVKPKKSLDLLCWEINQEQIQPDQVNSAIEGVIDYFKKKVAKNPKLNTALEFLHGCLGVGTTIPPLPDDFKNCKNQYSAFQQGRNNQYLRILRDAMLKEAGAL